MLAKISKWLKDNKTTLVSLAVAVGALVQGTLHAPAVHEVVVVAGATAAAMSAVVDIIDGFVRGADRTQ